MKKSNRPKPASAEDVTAEGSQSGLVISHHGAALQIETPDGRLIRCTSRRKIDALVCGDRVRWQPEPAGEGVIVAVEPRRTLLVRPDARGQLKPMAANVDQLLVVAAPRRPTLHEPEKTATAMQLIDEQLIDRYLVAAVLLGIEAMIVINKMDLFTAEGLAEAEQLACMYREIGYRVLFTAAKLGTGLTPLREALKNKVSVVSGQSGVGKSSLVNALQPGGEVKIGEVAAGSGAGRHTTTTAVLYHLKSGGDLIDSPGVRDFSLWKVSARELAQGFVEFAEHARHCRFGDCSHGSEPGCAVERAAQEGHIHLRRLASYRRIAAAMQA